MYNYTCTQNNSLSINVQRPSSIVINSKLVKYAQSFVITMHIYVFKTGFLSQYCTTETLKTFYQNLVKIHIWYISQLCITEKVKPFVTIN